MNENHLKEFYDLTQQMTLLQLQTLNNSNEVKVETRESGCKKQLMFMVSCKIMLIFFSLLLMATGGNSFGQHTGCVYYCWYIWREFGNFEYAHVV